MSRISIVSGEPPYVMRTIFEGQPVNRFSERPKPKQGRNIIRIHSESGDVTELGLRHRLKMYSDGKILLIYDKRAKNQISKDLKLLKLEISNEVIKKRFKSGQWINNSEVMSIIISGGLPKKKSK